MSNPLKGGCRNGSQEKEKSSEEKKEIVFSSRKEV